MRGSKSRVGDTRVSPNGYHYTKTKSRGWQLTHRLVVEKLIGRRLRPGEQVRFIDGDRTNRDISNLEVRETKKPSVATRRARLEAKIEDLQAQLEDLDNEE